MDLNKIKRCYIIQYGKTLTELFSLKVRNKTTIFFLKLQLVHLVTVNPLTQKNKVQTLEKIMQKWHYFQMLKFHMCKQ